MSDLTKIVGFDWDEGNREKSVKKHSVSVSEAEQMFLNEPLRVWSDATHSHAEVRYQALGRTNHGRLLFAAFTLRGNNTLIRLISVRDMNARERRSYGQET